MANLALKAVMWGADKIPDRIFESVPGSFFRPPKDEHGQPIRYSKDDPRQRPSRRYSDDEYDGRHRSHHGNGHRRHRSRPSRRTRDDSDSEDYGKAPRHNSRSRDGRRNGYDDEDDRYGYTNGHDGRRPRDSGYEAEMNRPPYPVSNNTMSRYQSPDAHAPNGRATAAVAAAGAAAAMAPQNHSTGPEHSNSQQHRNSGFEQGYMPYSNIYSSPSQQSQAQPNNPYVPPQPRGSTVAEQLNNTNHFTSPVARPPYLQNPHAQDAPYGGQPGYILPDDDYDPREDPYYYDPPSHDNRRARTAYSRSPSRRGRDYSPSRASLDSRYDYDDRRTRSERRSEVKPSRGKSKSRIREAFDPSERGLGYGAVGALAGGLVGSEIGKGRLPAVLGAVLGGAGANAFQARERRKEGRRRDQSSRNGVHDRRNARAIKLDSSGYHSD